MSKMNSCDRRFRDERDLRELLEIADKATTRNVCALDDVAKDLRARYDALIVRRAAEDSGQAVA